MTALPPIDPTACPACGQANQCAMALQKSTGLEQQPCWCTHVDFSRELLESIPSHVRGLACICARCAQGGNSR